MVNTNAQIWLDKKYPINGVCKRDNDPENKGRRREEITTLDISKGKVGKGIFNNDGKTLTGSLKLEGFTNLRKLIISSHQIIGLDVNDCPNLEEVNINNCSSLEIGAIKSNLTYDAEKGKLVKDSSLAKNSPQIRKATNDDIRNILIVGITGNGKSALANALSDTSTTFSENASSTSVTKNFQSSNIFEYQGKKYRVIDNIGFGDNNNISDKDVLFKIGEGISSVKEGINQVLFVFKGRFSPEQLAAFNMFKDFISEIGITKFTTLVRTNFENFQSQESCREDQNDLLSQSQELKEIIISCNGVLHVDNPAIPVIKDKDRGKIRERKEQRIIENKKSREYSREVVLNHLVENCSEIYKLRKWGSIHDQVISYMKQITEKEQELAQTNNVSEKIRLQNEINETKVKIAEEVNATIELTARIEMKNINTWPFNKK